MSFAHLYQFQWPWSISSRSLSLSFPPSLSLNKHTIPKQSNKFRSKQAHKQIYNSVSLDFNFSCSWMICMNMNYTKRCSAIKWLVTLTLAEAHKLLFQILAESVVHFVINETTKQTKIPHSSVLSFKFGP